MQTSCSSLSNPIVFSLIKPTISHPQNDLFCKVNESLFIVENVYRSESVSISLGNNHCSWLKNYMSNLRISEILQNSQLFI